MVIIRSRSFLNQNVQDRTAGKPGTWIFQFRKQSEKFVKKYKSRTLLNRMATEKDIVGPVVFLSSSSASYITGENLIVDGGWTIK